MESYPQFIHFGCWGELYKKTIVNNVLDSLNSYILDINGVSHNKPIKFITIAGDNYYPKSNESNDPSEKYKLLEKEFIFRDFHMLMKKLPFLEKVVYGSRNLPQIKKYLLWGNHEMRDVTYTNLDRRNKRCRQLDNQIWWSNLVNKKGGNIEYFENVIINREFKNTLIIMIDTSIYQKKTTSECYNNYNILGGRINKKLTIEELCLNQFLQIKHYIELYNTKNIIFIGHHPIKSWREKHGEGIVTYVPSLHNLFIDLIDYFDGKNIYYLCADTHCYQYSHLKLIETSDIIIEHYVVGTGGADPDKPGDILSDEPKSKGLFIIDQKYDYGYLICSYKKNKWDFKFNSVMSMNVSGGKKNTKKRNRKYKHYSNKKQL